MCQLVEETAWHEVNEDTRLEGNGEDDGEGEAHGPRGNGQGDWRTRGVNLVLLSYCVCLL